ncbi:MAG: YceI family protein [Hyphomonadaceae bacterium]|nr:YceI family protein [Hyphomonadaceae bacterium]
MTLRPHLVAGVGAFALAACGGTDAPTSSIEADAPPAEAETEAELHPLLAEVAPGAYSLEKTHAFMTIKVGHAGGISQYRISFTDFDADLDFNPADPESSSISFSINPAAVETNYPADYAAGHPDSQWSSWNEDVSRDAKWLNADEYPEITFVSTAATKTGELSGTVTGDLTLLGVTRPVTLDVTYNGVANPPWFEGRDVIGFDASTSVLRSDFGMTAFIPNIGDEVTVEFSGEFLQDE